MPIVDIEIVGSLPADRERGLARALADSLGRALQTPAGGTWVRLRRLAAEDYAENAVPSPPADDLPVFVTILRHSPPEGGALHAELGAVVETIAAVTGRPSGRVHVLYEPPAAGRLAFGGRLVV